MRGAGKVGLEYSILITPDTKYWLGWYRLKASKHAVLVEHHTTRVRRIAIVDHARKDIKWICTALGVLEAQLLYPVPHHCVPATARALLYSQLGLIPKKGPVPAATQLTLLEVSDYLLDYV